MIRKPISLLSVDLADSHPAPGRAQQSADQPANSLRGESLEGTGLSSSGVASAPAHLPADVTTFAGPLLLLLLVACAWLFGRGRRCGRMSSFSWLAVCFFACRKSFHIVPLFLEGFV